LNECLLYRGVHSNSDICIYCKEYRYTEDTEEYKLSRELIGLPVNDNLTIEPKKKQYTARYIYRYCPIIPRLKSLIAHPVMSHLFRYADKHMINDDPNIVDDIHQAPAYDKFARHFPLKTEGNHGICDIRIALGIGADRASMSKHKQRDDFAVLPILACVMNWPIWFRSKEKHLLLCGLPPLKSHNPSIFFGKQIH
jgi:hypothetical protein